MDVETTTANPESSVATVEAPAKTEVAATTNGTTEGQNQQVEDTKSIEEKLSIMGVEIEKSKVPPELLEKVENWNKSYTEKSQALSAAEKKAQALDQLSQNPNFVKWYWEQVQGKKPEEPKVDPYDLTPERQAELLSDPQKMKDYFKGLATSVMQEVALPAAQKAQYEAQVLRSEREVESLASKYPDFQALVDNDKIQEVVQKYLQKGTEIDLEDAYWLAKRAYTESEAELKAHSRVQEKVNGNTLQPTGSPTAEKIKLVSGKGLSFEEKMRIAAEHAFRNEKVRFDS